MKKRLFFGILIVIVGIVGCDLFDWWFRFFINLILWVGIPLFLLLLVFNTKKKWITGGKLHAKGRENERRNVEYCARGLCVGFVLGIIFIFSIPIFKDTRDIILKKSPVTVQKKVKETSSYMGMYFLGQSVFVKGEEKSYGLLFSITPKISHGSEYTFLVLPHSRIIVDIQRKDMGDKELTGRPMTGSALEK